MWSTAVGGVGGVQISRRSYCYLHFMLCLESFNRLLFSSHPLFAFDRLPLALRRLFNYRAEADIAPFFLARHRLRRGFAEASLYLPNTHKHVRTHTHTHTSSGAGERRRWQTTCTNLNLDLEILFLEHREQNGLYTQTHNTYIETQHEG